MKIYDWIFTNLKRDGVVVEAGVYNGQDTALFCQYFSEGMVYGFEPVRNAYKEAVSRTQHFSNVEIQNKALSDISGKAKMHYSDRFSDLWGSSSLLKPKDHLWFHPEITFNEEIEVETVNLDDWLENKQLEKVDLMWLDLQGSESVVLSAAPKTLSVTKYLYCEVSLIETYENVMKYPDFKHFLVSNGFEPVFEDLPWKDMGNVLFKNTKIA